ncbi:MAG: hypothetical protein JXB32_13635 [Deltaproteobacteria bacterium]|nr:hypothetical protein [Deltaproteobacteria bacterium]
MWDKNGAGSNWTDRGNGDHSRRRLRVQTPEERAAAILQQDDHEDAADETESPVDQWPVALVITLALLAATQMSHCSIAGMTAADESAPAPLTAADAGAGDAAYARSGGTSAAPSPLACEPVDPPLVPDPIVPGPIAGFEAAKVVAEAGSERPTAATKPLAAAAVEPTEVFCPDPAAAPVKLFLSPARPVAGRPLRITAVSETEQALEGFELLGTDGREFHKPQGWSESWGGPPWAWSVTVPSPAAGTRQVLVRSTDPARPLACGAVEVLAEAPRKPRAPRSGVWEVTRAWNRELENLYAAWFQRLFLVDAGAKAGWRPLHQVLHDPRRNLLWGYLGLDEDDPEGPEPVVVAPDCGDTPFFLRAYFSWKLGLPFAVRHCARGTRERGTRCDEIPETNLNDVWDDIESPVKRFNEWLEEDVGDTVHSGTGRALPELDAGELYPVALSRDTLRPGTVFIDVGGHVLITSRWVAGSEKRIGMLLAIDGHPDRTVSHKRFSRANFYFDPTLRTGGFKAFRPVRYERGRFRFANDEELAADPDYPDPSTEQYDFRSAHEFYRTVVRLLNPEPLDPVAAYRSQMEALVELIEARVAAVQVGVEYMEAHGWWTVEMPEGGAIFETRGPWEDYSTPARDLRLLLAMDELLAYPGTVFDDPVLFKLPPNASPAELERMLRQEWNRSKQELFVTYQRSDNSTWKLTLGELMDRIERFEQSYNPNDCPEVRWGAMRGTPEFEPCARRAPMEQRNRMSSYRYWHAERRRPSAY